MHGQLTGLSAERFARLFARLGPFEPRPVVVVAVSGGPDSLALTLLLDEWAGHRGARIEAITVDHALRPESAEEADQVGRWLGGCANTRHTVLRWIDAKPAQGLQEAARNARYRLLTEHCRANGFLHLCLAHHLDDQIETRAMRAARQSTPYGLAGMSAIHEWNGVRLLRPLLGISKKELKETLVTRGQPWIEDPSNRNPSFERARLRNCAATIGRAEALTALHRAGLERRRLEGESAARLCDALQLHEAGWATIDGAAFGEDDASALAFARLLRAIGGTEFLLDPARRLEGLARIRRPGFSGFTLGGCYIIPWGGRLLVCRDWGAIAGPVPIPPSRSLLWDRRFALHLPAELPADGTFTIARLGESGIRQLGQATERPQMEGEGVPLPARKALPTLWRGERLVAVPHLGFGPPLGVRFRPINAATSSGFTVAY